LVIPADILYTRAKSVWCRVDDWGEWRYTPEPGRTVLDHMSGGPPKPPWQARGGLQLSKTIEP
jgi:hypothetical protein